MENGLVYFLAIGPFCWGRGTTEKEAIKNCKKNAFSGGRVDESKFSLYRVAADTYVNEMGGLVYKKDGPKPEKIR